jgi:hypothetical protein
MLREPPHTLHMARFSSQKSLKRSILPTDWPDESTNVRITIKLVMIKATTPNDERGGSHLATDRDAETTRRPRICSYQ